ncbi:MULTISPECIES: bifunctional hydroxymethylpyrimidine kinase/phosphomethylpyrimidine kinase [Nitrosomonas]|uniref:hydroxymethylpyrimidine kinase n=1 Tax=Nitrosomonas communis TaxID=44574 RepID=A0A0F7KHL2_9PROT|nr:MULTISPECIES: hydroxymethylpyrimidine/phosphomethylpyrimidine kinase [Nitrosomonas]AKH38347.1 phosphomethylpyrimidine kinase [Nitrosomonas communis]TYP90087.1 hydroxymethylpyrimidine/phosphomethylpyrimidine kinase [Nitrosomonas communis]UVS60349.1 hydroxymethylpyrimidine/phosphomethylpyrimidine kinase [Nitrosomonas sp. PLL12]
MSQPPPKVLSFAASDPSGGAGIQADILTLASIGCHPLSVITAVTIQDTVGIENIMALDSEWITDQARIVLEDMPVDAFKIGLLGSVETVVAIAEIIADYPDIPVVLDPVLASGRGDPLANEQIITAIRDLLIPQTTIITPNSLEARRLILENEDELEIIDLKQSADRLLQIGCEYALITGTHENTGKVINTLYDTNGVIRSDEWQRLPGSYHGSGCTLSSAIAASLAHGLPIAESVYEAQDYTWHALKSGFRPGMGQYLPDRFFWASDENDLEEKKS